MNEIRGYYNVWFRGADTLIALLEYHGVRWHKEGRTVTAFGVSKEFRDLVMEIAPEYDSF